MTDAYRSDMVEAMKMLYGVSRKVERYKTRLDVALQVAFLQWNPYMGTK